MHLQGVELQLCSSKFFSYDFRPGSYAGSPGYRRTTPGESVDRQDRADGNITPVGGLLITVAGDAFDQNYAVNTIFSANLVPTFSTVGSVAWLPTLKGSDPPIRPSADDSHIGLERRVGTPET
jgi:hypothetical protein